MVNAVFDVQASWLSDYNGGIYDDSRQSKIFPQNFTEYTLQGINLNRNFEV